MKILVLSMFLSSSLFAAENCKTLTSKSEDLAEKESWTKAIEEGQKAVKACADSKQKTARPYMVLAKANNELKNYEQTIKWSKEALTQEPGLALAYMNMCAGYMSLEKFDEAITACKNGLKKDSQWAGEINYNTGLALFKKYAELQDFVKIMQAEPYFLAAQKIMPKESTSYYYVGLINQANNKNQVATQQFKKGCDLGDDQSCTALKQMIASAAQKPAATQATGATKSVPVSAGEEQLYSKIKEGYIKKGISAEAVGSMIADLKKNFANLTVEQRMTALKNMADSL